MSAQNTDLPRTNEHGQPIGPPMPDWTARPRPAADQLRGRYYTLERLDVERHADVLYAAYSAASDDSDWTYLPVGPFDSREQYRDWARRQAQTDDPWHYAVVDDSTGRAVGTLALMRQDPSNGAVEVGWVVFSRAMQRTPLSTEAHFLLMRYVFDEARLPPLRVEVRQPQRPLAPGRRAPGLHLRGHVPPGRGLQRAQPRHDVALGPRP